jgi:hypothetical protein
MTRHGGGSRPGRPEDWSVARAAAPRTPDRGDPSVADLSCVAAAPYLERTSAMLVASV